MKKKHSNSNIANNYEWELIYAMPNLKLDKPFESEFMAIVPFDDERIKQIISTVKMANILLTNFKTETGELIEPCALIWRKDSPDSIKKNDAVVAFRNSFAISCLVHGYSRALRSANVFEPTYSDHFDFFPVMITKTGEGFIISTPATMDIWPEVDEFHGHTYPHIPTFKEFKAIPNDLLAKKNLKQWKIRFVSPGRDSWSTRLLFRSFEVAYQALLSPYRHSSLYEFGTHLSLWTSAFETLVQKKANKDVGYKDVLKLLGQYKWGMKILNNRRYKIYKDRESPKGNLVQKLYREMNDARNFFFHGNPVTISRLFPFRKKERPPLLRLAPIIYWTALSVYLPPLTSRKKVERGGIMVQESFDKLNFGEALLSAIGLKLEDMYKIKVGFEKRKRQMKSGLL